ncbi:hypothetical protein BT96DRAFT_984877 [Gymnopus androsaceus JB14]|uniref:Uncharacterized protein n=1 Tax=Gymnopus androsaceus JB14 TaxID=1447944 RepID=A0A6A4IEV3_9AGAR|nr:hypothetical protein BT96DRAFT_984877 [Gymnopus androsaceus JB14]
MSPSHCPLPPCEVLIQNAIGRARQRDPSYQDIDPGNNDIVIAPLQGYHGPILSRGQYAGQTDVDAPIATNPTENVAIGVFSINPPLAKIEPKDLERSSSRSSLNRHITRIPITKVKTIRQRIEFRETASLYNYPGVSVPAVLVREDILVDPEDRLLKGLAHISVLIMLPFRPIAQYTILTTCYHKTVTRLDLAEQLCMLLYNHLHIRQDTPIDTVRSIERLRLISVYSEDLESWFVELAYHDAE